MNIQKLSVISLLSFGAFALSNSAFAEGGCPSGYVPTPNQGQPCAADYNLPHWNQGQPQAQPQVRWADRWGAMADDGNGTAGIVESRNSKREAEVAAVKECKKRGGGNCKTFATYYNQCAAIAAGGERSDWARAETKELAIKISMDRCEKKGINCRVYYSGCSLPVRIQ
ncbi:protein of unknown function [Acinetobacter marinus]|uniref:DUF4189 domain-containing protein n=1 Tax=Acinetobacter marinus TaxID=281375 RepID=A0A1G6IFV6_9GAMM|nr:DUF4189 domain-containing protein [Acinetobacter marinus]SDC05348.1 protein of unknown function [Acinetobacter marinus]